MVNILLTDLVAGMSRNHPTPFQGPSEILDLVADREPEATPPYKERLGTNTRTWMEQVWVEVVWG
jgi:hypothetical protein